MAAMKTILELLCRGVFWLSAAIGFAAMFLWLGRRMGDYFGLAIFLAPFWITGVWLVIQEIRRGSGKGLRYHGLYKDQAVD